MAEQEGVLGGFDAWCDAFVDFVRRKGKVPPGRYRAYGYEAPGHALADLRLKWRSMRMSAGRAPAGSSPAAQHRAGLNRDATWRPKASERTRNP
jgi:hypothetical protein